jgi:hypothetical protein
MGRPPAWRLGVGLTIFHSKKYISYEYSTLASNLDEIFG